MVSVNGYFDGNTCIALDTSHFHPNQRLIITALDEDFEDKKQNAKKQIAFEALHGVFGTMTHAEAEDIRNNRVNFKERF